MGYSRATRKQIIALDLVEGVIDAEEHANPDNEDIKQLLKFIKAISGQIRASLVYLNSRGGMLFESQRELDRYRDEVQGVQKAVIDAWPGDEIDGREYLNAILLCLEDRFASVPCKTQELWKDMVESLQALYEQMDPGLEAEVRMDAGEIASRALIQTIEDI